MQYQRARLWWSLGLVVAASCAGPGDDAQEPVSVAQATRAAPPRRVVIVLFDQMIPGYADRFDMPNFRRLRAEGTYFDQAHLGYMASETVISHNVITSGLLPKNMGWVDEAYRDVSNLLGKGAGAMHLPGSFGFAEFGALIAARGYPKLADYLSSAYPGTTFIVVGQKAYAVESAAAGRSDNIAVRMSSRSSGSLFNSCRATLGGRYRFPAGVNVPAYLLGGGAEECNRFFINSDADNDYGTKAGFPSWLYPEDGNRYVAGPDPAHQGGDAWVADAAIEMMARERWSGMFLTLGAIDKAGHMWGAQSDTAPVDCSTGAGQTHVRCAAEQADVQLGKVLAQIAAVDAADGGETLVVLTADHGGTWGEQFYGKTSLEASGSNWYYAPTGVWDGTTYVPPSSSTYNQPSPALAPLIATGNLQLSYQSNAIEAWLVDRSPDKLREAAAVGLTLPGASAAYYRSGAGFALLGANPMPPAEHRWWRRHARALVDAMASEDGPDVVVLLHDEVSYAAYGDHGGTNESVQRIPVVFWSPSLASHRRTGQPFTTPDILPTILAAMQLPLVAPVDGVAHRLARAHELRDDDDDDEVRGARGGDEE